METYWINLPYATFGIEGRLGKVVRAAPIAKWAIGKSMSSVLNYYAGKGAEIRRIDASHEAGQSAH